MEPITYICIFITIVIIHFFADFVFQDSDWANNKSKSNIALSKHVLTYSSIWLIPACILISIINPGMSAIYYVAKTILFGCITFLCHFVTDYITSRKTSKMFASGNYSSHIPNIGAFTVIGADQVLHYIQLILTLFLL